MKLTIVTQDNLVIIDGFGITTLDLSDLPSNLWAVQWDTDSGHEELTGGSNIKLTEITKYQLIINAHAAAKELIENPPPLSEEELLTIAQATKRQEVKQAYIDEEENSTIVAGLNTYPSNDAYLTSVYVKHQLAIENGETEMIVSDVDYTPHTVSVSQVMEVLQGVRIVTRVRLTKAKQLYRQISQATTVAEVEAISW